MKQSAIFNSFVQQEYFQQSDRKVYKEWTPRDYYQTTLDKIIDQGKIGLPEVWSTDRMIINTPRDNTRKANKSFYQNNSRYDITREKRAKIILSKENAITKIKNGIYLVRSETNPSNYKVQWNGIHWICNCPDYTKNGSTIGFCKHIIALKLYLEIGYVTIEGEEPKIAHVTYSQDWANYNKAQSQEMELFDQFLNQLLSTIEEIPQHGRGRPGLKLRDQIFCCVMKNYSQLSSRRSQCLFHQALQRHQITHSPHYNALSKTLLKPEITPVLHELIRMSALPLASVETDFAIDSSGFRCSSFGRYCEQAHGTKRMHNWLKVHICTGVTTNIIADVVITDEHANDSPQFKKLLLNTSKYFDIKNVSADLAYSSRKNLEIVDKLGGMPYIPFKKNATGRARGSALWNKSFHYFQLHKDEFKEHYHKRSNAESTFGAIKKKFGESVKSKNRIAQENELLCKIIAYNITVLIHEMIQLNGTSDFLSFNGIQAEETLKPSNEYGNMMEES